MISSVTAAIVSTADSQLMYAATSFINDFWLEVSGDLSVSHCKQKIFVEVKKDAAGRTVIGFGVKGNVQHKPVAAGKRFDHLMQITVSPTTLHLQSYILEANIRWNPEHQNHVLVVMPRKAERVRDLTTWPLATRFRNEYFYGESQDISFATT